MTPTATATGIHTTRQRRVRQPIATISTTTVVISIVSGSQPPRNEIPWPNLLKLGSGSVGIGVGVGTGDAVVVSPFGGTPPVWDPFLKNR